MKKVYRALLLLLFIGCVSSESFIYWDNLSDDAKQKIIDESTFNKQISQIDILHDVEYPTPIDEMLIRLTSPKLGREVLPYYFHVFNAWCQKSDGAIAEIMGTYCTSMVLNYPDYVLNYFQSHLDIMESYASYIGYELAWKDQNNRVDPASQKFFATLKSRTQDFRRYRKIYDSFCAATQTWMNRSVD